MKVSEFSVAVFFVLFLISTAAEAKTVEEDFAVKSVKQETKLSRSEVLKVLKKANLTNHGYKEEVSYHTVKGPGSNKFYFKESHYFFKEVNCRGRVKILKIGRELNRRIRPGVFDPSVARGLREEVKNKHFDRCKVGLEIDFTKQDQAHQLSKRWLFSKRTKTKTKTKPKTKPKTKTETPKEQKSPVKAIGSVKGEGSVKVKIDNDGWSVEIVGKIEAEGTVTVDNGGSKSGKKSAGGSSSSSGSSGSSSSSSSGGSSSSSSSSGGGGGWWWGRR